MDSEDSGEWEAGVPFIPTGLYKRSQIHNFFVCNKDTNKSVWKNKKCKAEIQGKNSTNLANHLKISVHINDEYQEYLKEFSGWKDASRIR